MSTKVESIEAPSIKEFSLTPAEHQQETRHNKEEDSRDPNFDRDNPTPPKLSTQPSLSKTSSSSQAAAAAAAISTAVPLRKAECRTSLSFAVASLNELKQSDNQSLASASISTSPPSRKASMEVLSRNTIHGKTFVPLSKSMTRSDTMKIMSHLEKKKVFKFLKIKKNDGTIKRRLVSDVLPSVPVEAPITSTSYRHYREATTRSKKIMHKKLINRSDTMKIMSHLEKKKRFQNPNDKEK